MRLRPPAVLLTKSFIHVRPTYFTAMVGFAVLLVSGCGSMNMAGNSVAKT